MLKVLKVQEAYPGDALKGIARVHPEDMKDLGVVEGELVEITGKKTTVARIKAGDEEGGRDVVRIDGLIRENAVAALDEWASVEGPANHHFAGSATLQPLGDAKLSDKEKDEEYILSLLTGHLFLILLK